MSVRIGVDIGGTFTDFAVDVGEELRTFKVPSTRPSPAVAVSDGLAIALGADGPDADQVTAVAHGTTVATNAMIEGRLARVGLITTRGFRDLLEIARQRRPSLYDLQFEKPAPLVERALRMEVDERLAADGAVVVPLDEQQVAAAADRLVADGVEALVIGFLHAYRNPVHEQAAAAIVQARHPEVPLWTSSGTIPEYREFERLSTTVVNAALGPIMQAYLADFEARCEAAGIAIRPHLMQSNGGVTTLPEAGREPARTLLSGPAAGVLGAIHCARGAGAEDAITFDMGGTSTDISLVRAWTPLQTRVREVDGVPVLGATMDVTAIGAGGGSIAWIDAGVRLRVGPRSAGSVPGPAAYGRGGEEPTVSDANVVAGRLGAGGVLGGSVALDEQAARRAIERHVAVPLELSVEQAALAILRVVDTNMSLAARTVSVARGHDPRGYALIAYGGAGPLHAVAVARELRMGRVVVPPSPGTLCALGLLVSDRRTEFTQTRVTRLAPEELAAASETWARLEQRAAAWAREHAADAQLALVHELEMRYCGQHHELKVIAPPPPWDADAVAACRARFLEQHERANGYAVADEPIEIVTFRIVATVARRARPLGVPRPLPAAGAARERGEREVLWDDDVPRPTAIVPRAALAPGERIAGPAIVDQPDATTAVPPGTTAHLDGAGNLVIEVGGEAAATAVGAVPEASEGRAA